MLRKKIGGKGGCWVFFLVQLEKKQHDVRRCGFVLGGGDPYCLSVTAKKHRFAGALF